MQGANLPTITVVIPAFNAATHIGRTILSFLEQEQHPDEILVIDDGSSDNTRSVAESFGGFVRVVSQENQGVASARYQGVVAARGDIVIFSDAGDRARSEKVKRIFDVFSQNPDVVACFGVQWNTELAFPTGSRWFAGPLDGSVHLIDEPFKLLLSSQGPFAHVMDIGIRRDVALISLRVPSFYKGANDYAAQLSTSRFGKFAHISAVTSEYALLPGGISKKLGLPAQYGFSLCAAVEFFEASGREQELGPVLRRRVARDAAGGLLGAYLKGDWSLFRRLVRIQFKYGSPMAFIKRFGWALDNARSKALLSGHPLLLLLAGLNLKLRRLL